MSVQGAGGQAGKRASAESAEGARACKCDKCRDCLAADGLEKAEALLREIARSPDPKWNAEQIASYFAADKQTREQVWAEAMIARWDCGPWPRIMEDGASSAPGTGASQKDALDG